jgi:hypothetical protein
MAGYIARAERACVCDRAVYSSAKGSQRGETGMIKKRNVQRESFFIVLLLLLVSRMVACEAKSKEPPVDSSVILPVDRRIDWTPGMAGDIPTYPVAINVKNAPYNARGDGIADDTAALRQAITNCPTRSAVYLPAGTYRLTSPINIVSKSIVLRGDGPNRTFRSRSRRRRRDHDPRGNRRGRDDRNLVGLYKRFDISWSIAPQGSASAAIS